MGPDREELIDETIRCLPSLKNSRDELRALHRRIDPYERIDRSIAQWAAGVVTLLARLPLHVSVDE